MRRITAIILIISILSVLFAGCSKKASQTKVADYGTYGSDFARRLASEAPYRKAYSADEQKAGSMIKEEFEKLGYEVQTQPVTGPDGKQSNNYIAVFDGEGFFSKSNDTGDYIQTDRYIVVGAHYDSKFSKSELDEYNAKMKEENGDDADIYEYDGINDNASGVGALLTCAKEIKNLKDVPFNVIFVAFGASGDDLAGSKTFFSALTPDVRSKLEVMICIDSIYAGDKIYANSGLNSLLPGRKYAMRRKLYQAYDVAYENSLSSLNGFNLLYNESRIQQDLNGDGSIDIYSEVSLNVSDYQPFDNAMVPVVYFDSFDYNFKTVDEMHDTKNLDLQAFDGMIRGTYLDSMKVLDPIHKTSEADLLQVRINNVACVILGLVMKGSDSALTAEQYKAALEEEKNPSPTSRSALGQT